MMLEAGDGSFEKIEVVKDGKAEAYAVRCGETTFVYVYNGNDEVLDNISIKIGKAGKVKVSALDPETVSLSKAVKMTSDGTLKFEGLGLKHWEEKVFVIK
jgi:hypothetical protein